MPRVKLNRFRVTRPAPDVLDHYWRVVSSEDLYFRLDELPRLDSETLFGNLRPLVIDLGSGRGRYINRLAAEHPALNFIGFDLHYKSLYDAINTAHAEGLENVRYVRADFRRALGLVPDAAAVEMSLLFPPPILKHSKRQRDPLPEALISEIARVLAADGLFRFVTDSQDYFETKVALIQAHDAFEPVLKAQRFEGGMTRFQQFWEGFDIPSWRFETRRRPSP